MAGRQAESRAYTLGRRAEKQLETRSRLLGAARELITSGGFRAASLEDVAERAGVTRVTVYRHFGSRLGLLQAAMWDQLRRAGWDRLRKAREAKDPHVALRRFLRVNCEMFEHLGDAMQATLDEARREPDVARLVGETYYGTRMRSLEEFADRLDREGVLAEAWNRRSVVDLLMMLTSVETFFAFRRRRGYSVRRTADTLYAIGRRCLVARDVQARDR